VCTKVEVENLKGRNHLGDLQVEAKIILKTNRMLTGFMWFRIVNSSGFFFDTLINF